MSDKQVTAHDFLDYAKHQEDVEKGFDYLLSQARQEARREALKEMDEALTGGIGGSPLVTDDEIESLRSEYRGK